MKSYYKSDKRCVKHARLQTDLDVSGNFQGEQPNPKKIEIRLKSLMFDTTLVTLYNTISPQTVSGSLVQCKLIAVSPLISTSAHFPPEFWPDSHYLIPMV